MTIHLATDHAGYKLKEVIKKWLEDGNYKVKDHGAFSYDKQDDYPDFIKPAAKAVARSQIKSGMTEDRGIIFGGSGQGEAMVANRLLNVRAAVFYGPLQSKYKKEIILSREHNDANVLALGAQFLTKQEAINAVKLWLKTPFSKAIRHKRRIKKFK